jgi:GDP-L-fucose synthase
MTSLKPGFDKFGHEPWLNPDRKIYIAGHRGLAGSAIWRDLSGKGHANLIGWSSSELDLRDAKATMNAICQEKPDVIIMAAARVGGIVANSTHPVEFLNENIRIQTNVFEAAHAAQVPRLLFLGSSCIYPKYSEQPIKESALLTGQLEESNNAYAIAKIAGVLQVQSYRKQYGHKWISVMPTNLYGPGDNYNPDSSHVLAALVRRFSEAVRDGANRVVVWGSGSPRREFLHSSDLARGVEFLLQNYDDLEPINLGAGMDISIRELAELIAEITGFQGEIIWDESKPDGTPRKLLDVSKIKNLGWEPLVDLREGLEKTCKEYSEIMGI